MTSLTRLALLVGLLALAPAAHAEPAASLQKITGVVSVQRADGVTALAYEGVSLEAGDTVNTERESSALVVFTDNSQVALRPATRFQIRTYNFERDKPTEDNMVVALLKGGLRNISGLISKRGFRGAYSLRTPTSTIGIRGTDFTARLCDTDCEKEQALGQRIGPSAAGVIGRVAELTGTLTKDLPAGGAGALARYYPLFEGEQLRMGDTGYALLVMTDGTRLMLQAGGVVRLRQYSFEPSRPDTGNMLFDLSKGVLRAVSGLVGKIRPRNVRFTTPTATIGIRGTAFDIVCGRKDQQPCDGEVFVSMREGKTAITSGDNELEVSPGQTASVTGPGAVPQLLDETPGFIRENPNPLPESVPIDMNQLFGTGPQSVEPGLYASVNEGVIVVAQGGQEIEIGKGQSGVAPGSGGIPQFSPVIPAFLDQDPVLASFPFNPGMCMPN